MGDRLASTLIEANNIYQDRLANAMLGDMLLTFQKMYRSSPRPRDMQIRLKEIVKWNKDMIDKYTNQILLLSPLLDDLIAAVYLATVQVLSHVRLPGSKSDIRVQVPGKSTFVHTAYKLAAKTFYELIAEGHDCFQKGMSQTQKRVVVAAVHDTVTELLPLKQLLEAYIANEVDAEGMVSPEPFSGMAQQFPPDPPQSLSPQQQALFQQPKHVEPHVPEHVEFEQQEVVDDPEPEPEHEVEPELPRHMESNWMDEGKSDADADMPEKKVELSPGRGVMCEEAADDGELKD